MARVRNDDGVGGVGEGRERTASRRWNGGGVYGVQDEEGKGNRSPRVEREWGKKGQRHSTGAKGATGTKTERNGARKRETDGRVEREKKRTLWVCVCVCVCVCA